MMGSWLARLKNEKAADPHATKTTKTPQGEEARVFVGFVAYPPAPLQKLEVTETAANDNANTPSTRPDRWSWPHSQAMNTGEIDDFTRRMARFTDKGVNYEEAERLADMLVMRDREGDDRRLCLECTGLHGFGRWLCANWQAADVTRDGLARDLVLMMQRCSGFKASPN